MTGWIKLHRKIQDCFLWDDPFGRKDAWIDLLLLVNHKDKKVMFDGKLYTVKAGQRITSIRKLSNRWHWSKDKTVSFLKLLESEGMITREADSRKTIITVVNYGLYQGEEDAESDTDKDTDKDTEQDTHKDTDSPQTRMIKNEKNEKKIYGEYRHVKLTDQELGKLQEEYGEEMTTACIVYLDEYIEMKGYKAKSHYLCIRKWVVSAVKEKRSKEAVVKKDTWNINRPADEYADLIKALEGDNDN